MMPWGGASLLGSDFVRAGTKFRVSQGLPTHVARPTHCRPGVRMTVGEDPNRLGIDVDGSGDVRRVLVWAGSVRTPKQRIG